MSEKMSRNTYDTSDMHEKKDSSPLPTPSDALLLWRQVLSFAPGPGRPGKAPRPMEWLHVNALELLNS